MKHSTDHKIPTHNYTMHQIIWFLDSKEFRRVLSHFEYTKTTSDCILTDEHKESQ